MALADDVIHAWEIEDRPGVRLHIGVRPGRARPEMWITSEANGNGQPAILASFHGEMQAQAAINFFDTLTGAVQRAIDHHTGDKQ